MSLIPVTPSGLHRLVLIVQDHWFDLRERVGHLRQDRDAVRRLMIWGAVIVLAVATLASILALVWYGSLGDRTQAATPTSPVAAAQLPGSPVEFTLTAEQLQNLTAEQAKALNATLPVSTTPDDPAPPFVIPADSPDFSKAVDCMTAAIYYEAANESTAGQAAVAQVVLNRMRHSAYPGTVCGVVFQGAERQTGCQFSFTCDGALGRMPEPVRWAMARATAIAALSGSVAGAVGHATHYHADYVSPYWAPRLDKVGQIGAHIFYRWPGVFGRPAAFAKVYRGAEPDIVKLRPLAAAGFGFLAPVEIVDLDPVIDMAPIELAAATSIPSVILTEDQPTGDGPDGAVPAVVMPVAPAPSPVIVSVPLTSAPTRNGERSSVVQTLPDRAQPRIARPSDW